MSVCAAVTPVADCQRDTRPSASVVSESVFVASSQSRRPGMLGCGVAAGLRSTRRFFPDAKTSRCSPGAIAVFGKRHLNGCAESSDSPKPPKSTGAAVGLCSSIQSGKSPSSSASVVRLFAITSLIMIPRDFWPSGRRPAEARTRCAQASDRPHRPSQFPPAPTRA